MARSSKTGSSVRRRFEDRADRADQHAVAVREAMNKLTGVEEAM
jgi:hypothetical protein